MIRVLFEARAPAESERRNENLEEISVPIQLTIAGKPISLSSLKDLAHTSTLNFLLNQGMENILDAPLSSASANAVSASLNIMTPASGVTWNPGGGPVQFGLKSGVTASFRVVNSGTLLSYTGDLDNPSKVALPVPPGSAFVVTEIQFSISVTGAGQFSGGAFGVKGNAAGDVQYSVTHFKAFPPNTTVRDALPAALQSFVLPLHINTLSNMGDGDLLLHEFDGKLNLGLGAYYGVEGVFLAGHSAGEVSDSLKSNNYVSAGISAAPSYAARVGADLAIQYQASFEALLRRNGDAGRLHVFRAEKKRQSLNVSGVLTVSGNVNENLALKDQSALVSQVASKLTGNLPDNIKGPAVNAIRSKFSSAQGEVDKYISEANAKVQQLLAKLNDRNAELQVLVESSDARTALADYDVDMKHPQFAAGWQAAMNGDFVQATHTGAFVLAPGSGVETAYLRRVSLKLNLFGLWQAESITSFFTNSTIQYAGAGHFKLIYQVGGSYQTSNVGALKRSDIYFAASANRDASGAVSDVAIALHMVLTCQQDPKDANRLASLLHAFKGGANLDALADRLKSFVAAAPKGSVQAHAVFLASAYGKIRSDNDEINWDAFVQACNDVLVPPEGFPAKFRSFAAWEDYNRTVTGGNAADRRQRGNPRGTTWPMFSGSSDADQQIAVTYLDSGQDFMNFCDDLRQLAVQSAAVANNAQWDKLLHELDSDVHRDVALWFTRPTLLALVQLTKAGIQDVTGPAVTPPASSSAYFTVQFTVA
jgi:hypothetical protein